MLVRSYIDYITRYLLLACLCTVGASELLRREAGCTYQAHYALRKYLRVDLDAYHDSSDDDVNMADL